MKEAGNDTFHSLSPQGMLSSVSMSSLVTYSMFSHSNGFPHCPTGKALLSLLLISGTVHILGIVYQVLQINYSVEPSNIHVHVLGRGCVCVCVCVCDIMSLSLCI